MKRYNTYKVQPDDESAFRLLRANKILRLFRGKESADPAAASVDTAEQFQKFKALLDSGVITQ